MATESKVRLNKFIANNGDISRRTADEYIQQRRVTVNNVTVDFPSYEVDTIKDKVRVDGELIKIQTKKIYIALNKPASVVSTVSDEKKRTTVIDLINLNQKIYPVGRLDYDTTGLILLTNDGELADNLMHPRNKVDKTYLVKLSKPLDEKHRHLLEKGVMLEGKRTHPAGIEFAGRHGFDRLYITIHEGRNKQVKKMFEHFGYFVNKLERTQFGPIKLGTLARGKWRYLTPEEVSRLYKKDSGSSSSDTKETHAKGVPKSVPKSAPRTEKSTANSPLKRTGKDNKKSNSKNNRKSTIKNAKKRTVKNTSKKNSKNFTKSKPKGNSRGNPKGPGKFTKKKSNKK